MDIITVQAGNDGYASGDCGNFLLKKAIVKHTYTITNIQKSCD